MLLRRSLGIGVLAAPFLPPSLASAQARWPQRPVHILVPFSAGGAADTLARILADAFAEETQSAPLVVENRAGAGGTLAAAVSARAEPDGHVLLLGDIGANAVAGSLFPQLPYDPTKAFRHVIHLVNIPMVLIAHPSVGDGTLAGLIAAARQAPGRLNYASAGPGAAAHLAMELFNRLAGTEIVHVSYRGGAPALQAIVSNEVQMGVATASTSKPFMTAGTVKAIGVGHRVPVALLPGVEPIANRVPGFEALTWHGIHVPAATPDPVVREINRVFNAVMARPDVRRRLEQQTAEIVGGTDDAYGRFVDSETAKWTRVVREARIRVD